MKLSDTLTRQYAEELKSKGVEPTDVVLNAYTLGLEKGFSVSQSTAQQCQSVAQSHKGDVETGAKIFWNGFTAAMDTFVTNLNTLLGTSPSDDGRSSPPPDTL